MQKSLNIIFLLQTAQLTILILTKHFVNIVSTACRHFCIIDAIFIILVNFFAKKDNLKNKIIKKWVNKWKLMSRKKTAALK